MDFTHYRCDWEHPASENPITLFYEVSASGDVPRAIDVFANGQTVCRAVADFAGRMNELPGFNSLVEGSFFDTLVGHELGVPSKSGGDRLTIFQIPYSEFRKVWCDQRGY
ncbi:hypothetical protein [Caulobacter sp. Root487D2Y]|uniref:hypothetical protein n=1 Tax=Caulobacter sp. Root487D2Y TaxID=1736547 RepID=UPI000ADA8230|nr:hypothetical protein [Caulobacter sp. Root487D2Y]